MTIAASPEPTIATATIRPVAAPPRARMAGLDLLRLLAIVLVLGRHMWDVPESASVPTHWFFATWKCGGWVGVDLFFVLSGYLVSGLLFSEYKASGRFSVFRFYTRRGWKIYPPFYCLLGATIAGLMYFGHAVPVKRAVSEALFVQNYFPRLWDHTWSLAVEEHFYLLLPLLLLAILRYRRRSADPFWVLAPVFMAVAAGLLVARLATAYYRTTFSYYAHAFPTHLRLDSLFFGVLIAYLHQFHAEWFQRTFTPWRRPLLLLGALLLMPAFLLPLESSFIYTAGFSLFYLGSGAIMIGTLLSSPVIGCLAGGLARLGSYSYSIYLWHVPVLLWGIPILEVGLGGRLRFEIRMPLYFIGSIIVGVATALLIEIPALRLRDRLFPSWLMKADARRLRASTENV